MPVATITVRIPSELKKRMALLSDVNWSEVVREALNERVELEFRRRRTRDLEEVIEASAVAGRSTKRSSPPMGKYRTTARSL